MGFVGWRSQESTRWVESALGIDVESCDVLVGGMSSEMRRFVLADGSAVVVRHITDRAWLEREPDLITREARALELLVGSEVPAPRLIASEPGAGLLAMSMMPGVVHHVAPELESRIAALAGLAATVAQFDLPEDHGLPAWTPWAPTTPTPPTWGDSGLWDECIAAYTTEHPPRSDRSALLHRDFHPLNVLWSGPGVAGLVDWVNACVGHPHAELGHCRWNLSVLVDSAAADAFLDRYLAVTDSQPYSTWWDLATVVGLLPGPIGASGWNQVGRADLTSDVAGTATEVFLRSVLEAL